jgi:hypothetical protein
LCARERYITESIGSLPEVQRIVQANLAAGIGELMRLLVKELHYDLPDGVTIGATTGKVTFHGNKWSKIIARIRENAIGKVYGAQLNELAQYIKMFNAHESNGYAVIRLRNDGCTHEYDGQRLNDANGEFVSMSIVFEQTLAICMDAGLHAITADATFTSLQAAVRLTVVDGIVPTDEADGLHIVPFATHIGFGETRETYKELWEFIRTYTTVTRTAEGKSYDVQEWMRKIILHADRGPSKCMDLALHDVFPEATMRSCAFHVMQGLERNGHKLERAMFYLRAGREPGGSDPACSDPGCSDQGCRFR